MTTIPIILRLKTRERKEIAKAQDIIVKHIFDVFNDAVFHGGTAIWRCYSGNRFSEDIDVYLPNDKEKLNLVFETLKREGFTIEKKKISENSLFSTLRLNNISVRFEALFKKTHGEIKDYEKAEGNFISVRCLEAEELIKEKVNAYLSRLKIRDLYDIFFLIKYVQDKNKIKNNLNELLTKFKNPKDEKDLNILVLEGLVPKVSDMLNYIGKT